MSYDHLLPERTSDASSAAWKLFKREVQATDILNSAFLVTPMEFVKTKHNCYLVKEYANGGSVAQLLSYRSQVGGEARLSEKEAQQVTVNVLSAITDCYNQGLAIWDLSPETLLLTIGPELSSVLSPNVAAVHQDGAAGNFAGVDSLCRNQFGVKVKDLAWRKRQQCE